MRAENNDFGCIMARFASNKIVIYQERFNRYQSEHQAEQAKINLEKKEYNGYLSKQTKSYITKILDTWYQACKYYNRYYAKSNQASKKLLTFVTLTLPTTQKHTDNEIKRGVLNHFIIAGTRSGMFKYYFWRAEKQKNGNIHFHLLIDSYIDKDKLRNLWNKCNERLGYIDDFEKLHGHRNPPSTHIQVIPSNQNIIDYVVKYVGKNECEHKVNGRIWGMSDELRNIIPAKTVVCSQMDTKISKYVESDKSNVYEDDNVIVIKIKWELRQKYEFEFRKDVFEPFERANCCYLYFNNDLPINVLYPKKEPVKHVVQLELKQQPKQQKLNFEY